MNPLDELANQKKLIQSLKHPQRKSLKTTKDDIDDFIENDEEGEEKLKKEKNISYASHSSDEEGKEALPTNQQQITQFMGQNKKKQKTGIMLTDDIDMEKVLEHPVVEKVTVNQVIRNEEELYKAQFNAPIQPQKETNDDDMDELFELMAKQKELKELKQQQVIKKPQPVHRKVELKMEINQTAQELSSLSFEQIKQGMRDVNDILETNNSILFYWLDVYEDQMKFPGALFVFGKVKNHKYNVFDTCSLYFDDYPKKIYLSYENGPHTQEYLLQECQLLMKRYLGLGVKDYKCQFVDKQYAFEISDIPTVTSQYLEVTYTQKSQQQIPVRLDNPVFKYALQSTQTTIEQFLIYNKIKGPCWLQIKSCKTMDTKEFHLRTQHCLQMEPDKFTVYKDIQPPPLKVLSLAIKSCQVNREEQIVAITCAVQNNIDQNDAEVSELINYYTMTRMPSDSPLPPGYVKGQNKQIKDFESEYSLMSEFLQYVEQVDPDALVGHDIIRKQLEMLYTRIAKLKVNEWNRMSRLQKREAFPKSLFVRSRSSTIGRLIIDTWLQASDMTKSNDYSLSYLCQQYLKQECKEIESDVTMQYMNDAFSYQALLQWNIKEAKYTIQLMQKLQIVSLTRQLTNIAGNVWNRSLINQRAERNEMLLMHEFFIRGYILPDRMSKINLNEEEREQHQRNQESQKTYGGGLVFEPKADIYTQFILLLDFNSLYPSIIMEYKICFTTVVRDKIKFEVTADTQPVQKGPKQKQKKKKEEQEEQQDTQQNNDVVGEVDPDAGEGILPQIIEKLVNMRKQAKKSMNQSEGLMKQVYNIKQLAVKLVANSIYGCLGFSSSRFYAVGIASLITKLGRKILLDSKQTVERNHDVIYGDTDSMMICTRQPQANNLSELLQIGQMIVKDINKKYKKLVLGIDGVFETLLLLKKKKYAGIKIDNLEQLMAGQAQEPKTKRETKGIDIVRREFCDISKKMQSHVLDILLTTKNRDTIFDDLYTLMQEIRTLFDYLQGLVDDSVFKQFKFIVERPLQSDFIIVKQLSKSPLEFADGINHPHVQVARRMMDQGRTPQSLVHHFIRYVICKDDSQKNISMRAYTIEEMIEKGYSIDHNYYISTQIFDPIVRLCKNINGLMISQMAQILGLKSYQHKDKLNFDRLPTEGGAEEENQLTILEEIKFNCPKCSVELKLSNYFDNKTLNLKEIVCTDQQCIYTQVHYKSLLNQTRLKIKEQIYSYYQGHVECKTISAFFTLNQKCFGTCCEHDKRKTLKSVITESDVNDKMDFLEKFVLKLQEKLNPPKDLQMKKVQHVYSLEKPFAQPYQQIQLNEIFNKLEL